MFLHWSTDPLLLDREPILYNTWLTANEIIKKEGIDAILNENLSFKNLYGIMIRKIDFVRTKSSDRIIARFPYIVITKEISDLIQKQVLLISEVVRNYFYNSINKSILQWKEIILKYLEKGSLPYPLFRCCFEIESKLLTLYNKTNLKFTSARGESFTFPTKITNKLAYLCGICNGDGNLRYYWLIVADETKEHIQFVSNLLTDLFQKEGKLMKTGGAWIVKLNLLWAVRLFNFLTNQSIDEPKYESLNETVIFQELLNDTFRKAYWRGIMDSDGSYSKYNISLTTSSKQLMNSFTDFLEEYNINYSTREAFYEEMNAYGYSIQILAASHIDFCLLLGSDYRYKKAKLENILKRKLAQQRKGQIIKLKEDNLTQTGYFDYNKIDELRILLSASQASLLYTKINYSLLQQKQSTHNRYKNGKLAIPLSVVRELLLQKDQTSINQFLILNKINTFYSGKSKARLPLKPNSNLQEIIPYIKLRKGYIIIDLSDKENIEKSFDLIQSKIRKLFSISISKTGIWNKVIFKFLKTYYEIRDF